MAYKCKIFETVSLRLEAISSLYICDSTPGMLDGFGGFTKVAICPMHVNSLQRVVVLATVIQGPIVTGWQATQLTYKQLKHTNSRYPS